MKRVLLVVGIICLVVCGLSLLWSAFNCFSYYSVLDGTADLYNRLHQRMIISLIVGIIFALIGVASLFIRSKI